MFILTFYILYLLIHTLIAFDQTISCIQCIDDRTSSVRDNIFQKRMEQMPGSIIRCLLFVHSSNGLPVYINIDIMQNRSKFREIGR